MRIIDIIKSTYSQLKQQRLLTLVSISGTALAIFLIMTVVMLQEVTTAPFAPESNRDRMLHYTYISVEYPNNTQSNCIMSWQFIKEVIMPLESSETFTCYSNRSGKAVLSEVGGNSISAYELQTDHRFWNVFDFTFVSGKPFNDDDFDTRSATAVICRSIARKLFGTDEAVGREILINGIPYKVTGVVKDVSELATKAYAQVWTNVAKTTLYDDWSDLTGWMSAIILARSSDDFDAIRNEIDTRTSELNKRLAKTGKRIITRNRPYDQKKESVRTSSAVEPDVAGSNLQLLIIYLILMIVPAINLLSMTQSRLKKRMSEIAIRRSFGCQRNTIIRDLLMENLMLTLFAGIIGLVLSVGFACIFDNVIFEDITGSAVTASLSELIHWSTFLIALLFCFILNLLSNSVPAWKASRTSIMDAMSERQHK